MNEYSELILTRNSLLTINWLLLGRLVNFLALMN